MIDITLTKLKYRNPNSRIRPSLPGEPGGLVTRIYNAGTFKSKSGNGTKKSSPTQGTGHRRRQGLGAIGF